MVKRKKPAFKTGIGVQGITYGGQPQKSGLTPNATGSFSQQAVQPTQAPNRTPAPGAPVAAQNPPPGPVNPFNVSSYNPASGNPDPRDANYFANLAKLQATSQQSYAAGQLEQTNADVNTQTQLGTMATDRQRNIRNLAESMLGKGLLRSGYHDRGQTEGTQDYLTAVTGVQTSKTQSDQQRAATMSAILQNLGIDEQGLYADAAGRYAQNQADAADRQSPTAPVNYPIDPGAFTGGTAGGKAGVSKKKNKKK